MKRILLIGETPLMASRFGQEIRGLGLNLRKMGVEVACLGFNYTGWPFRSDAVPYPLYPWMGSPASPENIEEVLNDFRPDTLVLPHQEEMLNITALEALYCGVPMILPAGGPTEEYLPKTDGVSFLEKHDIFIEPPNNTRFRIFDAKEMADRILVKFLELSAGKNPSHTKRHRKSMEKHAWSVVSREWAKLW